MTYSWCYDDSGTQCSGKAQQGTRNLRDTMDRLVPEIGDLGIYNCRPRRTSSRLSLHAEGRAWDAAIGPSEVALGNTLAQFLVDAAQALGVQRVIWGFGVGVAAKEWDSRTGERFWEPYSGPSHDDHVHVELCWESARRLTVQQVEDAYDRYWPEEDDMFSDDDKARLERVEDTLAAILVYLGSKNPDAVGKAVGRGDILSDVDFKVALAKAEGFNHKTGQPPPVAPSDD